MSRVFFQNSETIPDSWIEKKVKIFKTVACKSSREKCDTTRKDWWYFLASIAAEILFVFSLINYGMSVLYFCLVWVNLIFYTHNQVFCKITECNKIFFCPAQFIAVSSSFRSSFHRYRYWVFELSSKRWRMTDEDWYGGVAHEI